MCSVKRSSKNFAKFTGKHLYQGLLLMKLLTFRLATSLKRDSSTGVFLRILWHFQEHLFYRTPPMDAPGVQRRTLQFVKHLGWSSFSKELAVESSYFWEKALLYMFDWLLNTLLRSLQENNTFSAVVRPTFCICGQGLR